ncbi:MAG: hypothetical protein C3F13_02400 [Anaerolineales bacterium]|nr:MAG: hypothetical protein C3F13_02400 [Anaerolineales bacterium]
MPTSTLAKPTLICRYPIATSDMYYNEVGQRDVYVRDDLLHGFQIWGELTGAGPETSISLCQIFLEYAMFCQTGFDESQAYGLMESFGSGLGQAVALYMQDNTFLNGFPNPGVCALECMLETLRVDFTIHQIGPEMRFIMPDCPFDKTAGQTGLPQTELAHVGLNAMCQGLLHIIQPELPVASPVDDRYDHIFAIDTLANAQVNSKE